jgi:hypothetical protein
MATLPANPRFFTHDFSHCPFLVQCAQIAKSLVI